MMKSERNANPYRSLDVGDDEDFRTEIDDLLNDRDYLQASSQPKKARLLKEFKKYQWLLDIFLILVIIALLLDKFWHRNLDLEVNGDIVGFAPKCERHLISSNIF